MYDELIKRLRVSCETCKLWDGYKCCLKGECSAQKSLQAADAIDELQGKAKVLEKLADYWCERVPKWIPVTERLPDEEEVVLVWGGTSVYTAKRHNKYGGLMWWKLNSKQHYCNPTHWMPLPQPPEKEDIFYHNECEKEDGEA